MKKIFFSALVIFGTVSPSLSMVPVKAEHFAYFKETIKAMGFRCDTSDGGYAVNPAHIGGTLFKIYCNDNSLVYRVVVGGDKLCVEPWGRDNPMCM